MMRARLGSPTGHSGITIPVGKNALDVAITPDGQSEVIFEPQELQVQSVAVDRSGVVYAATNPDGKIYRIERHAPEASVRQRENLDPEPVSAGAFASLEVSPPFHGNQQRVSRASGRAQPGRARVVAALVGRVPETGLQEVPGSGSGSRLALARWWASG